MKKSKEEIPLSKEISEKFGRFFIVENPAGTQLDCKKYVLVIEKHVKFVEQNITNGTNLPATPLLAWEEETGLFWFNRSKYTVDEFRKVLSLLVFL